MSITLSKSPGKVPGQALTISLITFITEDERERVTVEVGLTVAGLQGRPRGLGHG